MSPLRIVLVMIGPPLPFASTAAGWHNVLVRELTARGHRLTTFVACREQREADEARRQFPPPAFDLRVYPYSDRTGLTAKWNSLRRPHSYMFSAAFRRDLNAELARGYDVLHLEETMSGWVGLGHKARALLNIYNLYSIDLQHARINRFDGWSLMRAERRLLKAYPRFLALTEPLASGIRRINPGAVTDVVPLGIDPELYPYIADDRRTTEPVLGVIGSMNWPPSRSAAVRLLTRIWPAVRTEVPEARVQVVGWGARGALRDFVDVPGVTIAEDVPSTRPYFEGTGVLVYAPERGTGMKVKIQEALGFGVPVVTTVDGIEGLPAQDGVHAGIANDDAGLIRRTVELLRDPGRRDRQRAAGRALLERHCGPGPTVDAIEQSYATLLSSARPVVAPR